MGCTTSVNQTKPTVNSKPKKSKPQYTGGTSSSSGGDSNVFPSMATYSSGYSWGSYDSGGSCGGDSGGGCSGSND